MLEWIVAVWLRWRKQKQMRRSLHCGGVRRLRSRGRRVRAGKDKGNGKCKGKCGGLSTAAACAAFGRDDGGFGRAKKKATAGAKGKCGGLSTAAACAAFGRDDGGLGRAKTKATASAKAGAEPGELFARLDLVDYL
jgi:hypothetical protein